MIDNYRKHKILKALDIHWKNGEDKSRGGLKVTNYGKSYTVNQLTKETGIDLQKVEDLCNSLSTVSHLEMIHNDAFGKAHMYVITPLGQAAFSDWEYPKKMAKVFVASVTTFVAIASFLWNIYSSQTLKDHSLRLQKLENTQLIDTITRP